MLKRKEPSKNYTKKKGKRATKKSQGNNNNMETDGRIVENHKEETLACVPACQKIKNGGKGMVG